jgi:hypothetical protein
MCNGVSFWKSVAARLNASVRFANIIFLKGKLSPSTSKLAEAPPFRLVVEVAPLL